jgi:hypothetical protein
MRRPQCAPGEAIEILVASDGGIQLFAALTVAPPVRDFGAIGINPPPAKRPRRQPSHESHHPFVSSMADDTSPPFRRRCATATWARQSRNDQEGCAPAALPGVVGGVLRRLAARSAKR